MKRYRYTVILLMLLLPVFAHAQEGYGLEFAAKKIAPELRTAFVIPDVQRHEGQTFSISFDLSFVPQWQTYFGYVFRLIDDKEQNIDLLYNVHARALQVVTGNDFSGINYPLDAGSLVHEWKNIRLDIEERSHTITMYADDRVLGHVHNNMVLGEHLKILFGANHDGSFKNIDLPAMRLRNVKISEDQTLAYYFPLSQQQGVRDTDLVHGKIAFVEHPVWLQPRYHNWQPAGSWTLKGNASVTFNAKDGLLYIIGQDSLLQVNVANDQKISTALSQPTGAPAGNQSVYDEQHRQLFNFFPDDKKVAVYDTTRRRWSNAFRADAVTRYWHPATFYSSFDSALYVIGGYGDYEFKNVLHRYHPATQTWDTPSVAGERLIPRYLSAVGMNARGDSAYIFGGYGSLQGAQLLNPHNLYDLLVYDVKRNTFKKIYSLPKPSTPFAFAGNLVIDSMQHAGYALTFANDRMQSSLQLIRADLRHPSYTKLGAVIPFPFIDTKSDASLYYCAQTGQLIAVTFYSADNKVTNVKMYTLLMPVNVLPAPVRQGLWVKYMPHPNLSAILVLLLLAGAGSLYFMRRRKQVRQIIINTTAEIPVVVTHYDTPREENIGSFNTGSPVVTGQTIVITTPAVQATPSAPAPETPVAAAIQPAGPAIHLFGHFTVLDKEGQDITRLFSPLVKELFLLILLPNLLGEQGITSEKLSEILWPSMTNAAAKNNRSVNIAKLRHVLEKVGDYSLVKENGKWRLVFDEASIYIDLLAYRQLTPLSLSTDTTLLSQYTALLRRGGFLEETEYAWMDAYKNEITSHVIMQLSGYLQTHAEQIPPATVIEVSNCILLFDALSEEAVMHQCRALAQLHQHASARKRYTRFQQEYENIYGEKYEVEYSRVIEGVV